MAAWDYGAYLDEVLVMYRDVDDNGSLEAYLYLQDDLYNVIGLTDASGNVVERYAYDDYGAPTIYNGDGTTLRTESAYGNPFLFQGRRWDESLRLYDYRTRYYDPALGRFVRMDTIGLWGDANNLGNPYTFVGNNPWSHVDPYGELVDTLWDIGSLGVGGASLAYNLWQGNWRDATVDAAGVVADTAATMVPFIPGGVGYAIRVKRIEKVANVLASTGQTATALEEGDVQAAALHALGAGQAVTRSAGKVTRDAGIVQNDRDDVLLSVKERVEEAATRAARKVGPGKGPVHGTQIHTQLRKEIQLMNDDSLFSEISYLDKRQVKYGTPGSIRIDVVHGAREAPEAIFDLKSGHATLTQKRIKEMQRHVPGASIVPIVEIRPYDY